LDRRLGGPQSQSGRLGEEKILDPTGTRTPMCFDGVEIINSYHYMISTHGYYIIKMMYDCYSFLRLLKKMVAQMGGYYKDDVGALTGPNWLRIGSSSELL
jgi:hypothetical protein